MSGHTHTSVRTQTRVYAAVLSDAHRGGGPVDTGWPGNSPGETRAVCRGGTHWQWLEGDTAVAGGSQTFREGGGSAVCTGESLGGCWQSLTPLATSQLSTLLAFRSASSVPSSTRPKPPLITSPLQEAKGFQGHSQARTVRGQRCSAPGGLCKPGRRSPRPRRTSREREPAHVVEQSLARERSRGEGHTKVSAGCTKETLDTMR